MLRSSGSSSKGPVVLNRDSPAVLPLASVGPTRAGSCSSSVSSGSSSGGSSSGGSRSGPVDRLALASAGQVGEKGQRAGSLGRMLQPLSCGGGVIIAANTTRRLHVQETSC